MLITTFATPITCPYPEPDESGPRPNILFHFNNILSPTPRCSKRYLIRAGMVLIKKKTSRAFAMTHWPILQNLTPTVAIYM
jgi:hypothetical protein